MLRARIWPGGTALPDGVARPPPVLASALDLSAIADSRVRKPDGVDRFSAARGVR
jgi:hypothetical protein